MKESQMIYITWPCGTICEDRELEEHLQFMSDDFERITPEHPDYNETELLYNS